MRKGLKILKYYIYCQKEIYNENDILDSIKRILNDITHSDDIYLQHKLCNDHNVCVALFKQKDSNPQNYLFKAMVYI